MEKSVKLIECFDSFQGEGPDSGHAMIILRFKTCNRKCPWCDTAVKMRISMEAPYKLSDLQKRIKKSYSGLLITGGEPTVERHFDETVMLLNELTYPIANVESNGYKLYDLVMVVNKTKPVKFIYSPKIFNEQDLDDTLKTLESLSLFKNVYLKIVYENNPLMIEFLKILSTKYQGLQWDHRIWLMPEGVTRSDLIRNSEGVFDVCEKYKFNFSSRGHIIFGFV